MKRVLLFCLILCFNGLYSQVDSLDQKLEGLEGQELVDKLNVLSFTIAQSDPNRAKQMANEAAEKSLELKYYFGAADAMHKLSVAHRFQGYYNDALVYADSAFGVYGALPDPIITEEFVYVLDMEGKKGQHINKYERGTGRLVWQSQEIGSGAKVVPNMYLEDGKLLLQIGGVVEIQGVFREKDSEGNITFTKRIYDENIKPCGVQAFSDEDGRLIWDSERFKKGITNMLVYGENLVVCSGKELYNIKIHDGEVNYQVDVKNGGVGDAVVVLPYEEMIVVVGEKGVSTFKVSDGSLVAANKYKRASVVDYYENILILETDKNDIAAFDVVDNCKYWAYNAKKGAGNSLTTDGKHVYVYEKKDVTRLFTTAQK